jgi:two-component system, LytTR family, response regulator
VSQTLIRTVVVDDEPIARRGVVALLRRHPDIQVVAECRSAVAAAVAIRDQRPDLMFLDIQLPVADGFASTDGLSSDALPIIVVTTAYPDYALRAYQHGAIAYLVKPLTERDVDGALDRARALIQTRRVAAPADYATRLAVRVDDGILVVRASDIDWIEADDDYVRIHVANRSRLVRDTMAELERSLDPKQFIRVHRSAIVNLDRVQAIKPLVNGRFILVLTTGQRIETSRARRSALSAALGRDF